MTKPAERVRTAIATLTEDTITVRGHNVIDLMDRLDVGQVFFLSVAGRLPDAIESRLINALIVSVVEHGMMPSVIAARMTLLGAPEALQGAVASGLLGVGDVYVGPTSNVAKMLQVEVAALSGSDEERAEAIVKDYMATKRRIPGLGHPHHPVDPRAERLVAMQRELGGPRRHTDMMLAIHRAACRLYGRHITLNGSAAIGSIASDLGIEWPAVRGIGLVARTVGLVGHVLEEMKQPSANAMWNIVMENTDYVGPPPGSGSPPAG